MGATPQASLSVVDALTHLRARRAVWAYDKKRASRDNQILKVPPEKRTRSFIDGEKSPMVERFIAVHAGQAALDETGIARTRSLVRGKG